jgi:cystathionine beta-synthase
LRYAQRLGPEHVVVALAADTGRNYLSKFFDETWLAENKLSLAPPSAQTIADLMKERGPRKLVTIGPEATADAAIHVLETKGISQLPVLADGKAVGSIQEVTLARVLHDDLDLSKVTVGEIMARPLPTLDTRVHLDEAYRLLLAGNTGVLITDAGKVVDIITRIDLVQYWDRMRKGRKP